MTHINEKLEVFYDLLVDNFATLEFEIKDLIAHPDKINNTNKFASLLSDLNNPTFIEPLLLKISLSDEDDPWLPDFLYAVIDLIGKSSIDEEFDSPDNLMEKLKFWIFNKHGEIAWKAANLLKYYGTEKAEAIQLKKLEERGDFFLTYGECLLGLLNFDKDKHWVLVKQISKDKTRDEKLRAFADDIIKNYP